MADEKRPPAPIADEKSVSRGKPGEDEAYSHWLNLTGAQRKATGDDKSAAASRPSTIEEHAKLKAAAKRQPSKPPEPDIVPVEVVDEAPVVESVEASVDSGPLPSEAPIPSAPSISAEVSQEDLRLLTATLEDHSRILAGLRAEQEKTVKWHHLWVMGVIFLLLIAGAFLLEPESLLTAIRNI